MVSSGCISNCYASTSSLLRTLTNSNYSTAISPNNDTNSPLILTIYFLLIKTLELTNSGTISVAAALAISWNDPRLHWDSNAYNGLAQTEIAAGKIWTPKLSLSNGVSKNLFITVENSTTAAVHANGNVTVNIPRQYKASCQMDLLYFPFDSQNCSLVFQIADLRRNSPKAAFFISNDKANLEMYSNSQALALVDSSITNRTICYMTLGDCYSGFEITLFYSRNPNYYIMNVIFPSILLTFFSVLAYLIPSDNSAKIAMSCSLMIALYVLQQAIAKLLPATKQTPIFAKALIAELVFGCLSLICTIITNLVHHMQPSFSPKMKRILDRFDALMCHQSGQPRKRNQVAPEKSHIRAEEPQTLAAEISDDYDNNAKDFDRLELLMSELVRSESAFVQLTGKYEAKRLQEAEEARYLKIFDLLLNLSLLLIFLSLLLACFAVLYFKR